MDSPPATSLDAGEVVAVAIVDDEPVVLDGLAALVRSTPGMRCVVAAAAHAEAVRQAEFDRPDVAVLDTSTGQPSGGPCLRMWRERLPRTRLLLLDDRVRDVHVRLVLKRQADGYMTKLDSLADLVEAIRRCARGEPAFSKLLEPRLQQTLSGLLLKPAPGAPGINLLTLRETEVLVYLAQGLRTRECSELLGISPSTVDNHKARILRKLNLRKTVELTRIAIREGLLPR